MKNRNLDNRPPAKHTPEQVLYKNSTPTTYNRQKSIQPQTSRRQNISSKNAVIILKTLYEPLFIGRNMPTDKRQDFETNNSDL